VDINRMITIWERVGAPLGKVKIAPHVPYSEHVSITAGDGRGTAIQDAESMRSSLLEYLRHRAHSLSSELEMAVSRVKQMIWHEEHMEDYNMRELVDILNIALVPDRCSWAVWLSEEECEVITTGTEFHEETPHVELIRGVGSMCRWTRPWVNQARREEEAAIERITATLTTLQRYARELVDDRAEDTSEVPGDNE